SGLDSGVGDYGPGVVSNAYDSSRWREEGAPITLFHGGMVDLTGDVEYEVSRHDSGQWGPGIYTTSSPFPAIKGWANPWKRNAEGSYDTGPPGYLHTTRWKGENPPRILDVEEALPDEIIDDVVIPTIEKLRREIDKARKEGTIERFTSEDAEYMLDEITDSIVSMRDRNNDITGRDTLLPIQQWLQEWEMPTEDNPGWNENGFLTLDRISTIRKEINTAIREQGHDVIKSHEKGIRDMSRTDYLFLDPDMVEFVDVASTHSLGGFGNMGSLEMHRIVTGRAKERENRGEAA
ncbi:MAG: hypothetical protein VX895_02445, partial [Chloroflexota bacterium]|nr:hypothetical protein [Chloroflexota bacterium]